MLTVAKPFATPSRRFATGQAVSRSEIDGPIPAERWIELGYLVGPLAPALPSAEPPAHGKPAKGKPA